MDPPSLVSQILESLDGQISDLSNFSSEIQSKLDHIIDNLKKDKRRLKNLTNYRKIREKEENIKIIFELIDSFYDMNKELQCLSTDWQIELDHLKKINICLEHSLRYLCTKLPENK